MDAPVRGKPFIVYVAGLALALILPGFIFSGVVAYQWVSSEKERLEVSLRGANEDALVQFDRYLVGVIAMLQALSTSPALDQRDFARVDRQARELGDLQGVRISVRDRSGQIVVNTRYPMGTPLPKTDLPTDRRVLATRQPDITDQVRGAISGEPVVIVNVPVLRHDEVVYFMSAILTRTAFGELIRQAATHNSPSFALTVADRSGAVLATTSAHPDVAHGRLPGLLPADQSRGRWSGEGPDGVPVVTSLARSAVSGWLLVASVDKAVMEAPLHRSEWMLAALALVLTALALCASVMAARRMMTAHRQVALAAKLLGDGTPLEAPRTAIQEVNLIGQEIVNASERLREQADQLAAVNNDLEHRVAERTEELAAKTELLEATLENMDQGLMMIDPDGFVQVCNRRAMELLDLSPSVFQARPILADIHDRPPEGGEDTAPGASRRSYERERPDGTVLEVRTAPLAGGGAVRTFTDITSRKASERQAQHMARHDPLTDLPNRTLFRERLGQHLAEIRRYGGSVAVLSLDLDRFKIVNDTMGHPAGDILLREVADRVKSVLRLEDTVSRLGGDEFAIVQVGDHQPQAASTLCERLIEAVALPFVIEGKKVCVGASIGIAVADEGSLDPDQLFKNSDRALYRAKSEGRGTFRFYEPGMDAAVDLRRRLDADLRAALARQEFALHFQPVLNVASGRVDGLEALLRWHHPSRGCMAPTDFIPAAEENGLMVPIGGWVLHEACRQAAAWNSGQSVAVNISAHQFGGGELVRQVVSALTASGLPARRLELEITEASLMGDVAVAISTLHHLRGLGVRVALDDFGTGHASLGSLHRFPFDNIKIDRSLVQRIGPSDPAMLRTIVGLGLRLGTAVTAEGVETQAQFDLMLAEGCTDIQGYLVSRPLPGPDALRLLRMTWPERWAGAA